MLYWTFFSRLKYLATVIGPQWYYIPNSNDV